MTLTNQNGIRTKKESINLGEFSYYPVKKNTASFRLMWCEYENIK